MLLDNYYKLLKQSMCVTFYTADNALTPDLNEEIILSLGTKEKITYNHVAGINPFMHNNAVNRIATIKPGEAPSKGTHIVFGTSNEMVTKQDYGVKGNVFTGIVVNSTETHPIENGVRYDIKFTNTGLTKEVGEICIYNSFAPEATPVNLCATWREVFQTKLIIPANTQFTYSIYVKVGV